MRRVPWWLLSNDMPCNCPGVQGVSVDIRWTFLQTVYGVCVPLSLLSLNSHGSLMTPLLFDAFRFVSPPWHAALLRFLLHNVICCFWTAKFRRVGFTLTHTHTHTILKCINCFLSIHLCLSVCLLVCPSPMSISSLMSDSLHESKAVSVCVLAVTYDSIPMLIKTHTFSEHVGHQPKFPRSSAACFFRSAWLTQECWLRLWGWSSGRSWALLGQGHS